MENYAHLIEIDEETRSLTVFRVDSDTGQRTLYTSVDIPPADVEPGEVQFREFARQLGENLLLDSPAARRLFGLS
jgi:hypothetical protein